MPLYPPTFSEGYTVRIAASNADYREIQRADYVCNGTADQTLINTVLNQFANNNPCPAILFSSGTFNLTATIQIPTGMAFMVGFLMRGCGTGTIFTYGNGANIYAITLPGGSLGLSNAIFADFAIKCNGANQTSSSGGIQGNGAIRCRFDKLWINQPYEYAIRFFQGFSGQFGYQNLVHDCFIDQGNLAHSGGVGTGIRFDSSDENMVSHCVIQNMGLAASANSGAIDDRSGLQQIQENIFLSNNTCLYTNQNNTCFQNNKVDGITGSSRAVTSDGGNTHATENYFYNISTSDYAIGFFQGAGDGGEILNNKFKTLASASVGGFIDVHQSVNNMVMGNSWQLLTGSTVSNTINRNTGAYNMMRNNYGIDASGNKIGLTENSGTATITSLNTSVVVNHGLFYTPNIQDVQVTADGSLFSAASFWVDTITSTQFTIHTNVAPASGSVTFGWNIRMT